MISRHAPENCPMVHEKTRKLYMDWFSKMDELSKKYNIKMIYGGSVLSEHLSIFIFEAQSLEAFLKAVWHQKPWH
jgi:ribonuclease HIII